MLGVIGSGSVQGFIGGFGDAGAPPVASFTMYYANWCPHCKTLVEKVFSQSAFQEFANKNLILVEVDFPESKIQSNALKKQNEELQSQYQVTGYPTLILLDPNGHEVKRSHGTSSPEGLIKWALDKP